MSRKGARLKPEQRSRCRELIEARVRARSFLRCRPRVTFVLRVRLSIKSFSNKNRMMFASWLCFRSLEESRNYLNKLGVSVSDVVQSSLRSVGVSGTPTLLLVDNEGSVTGSWVGKLSECEAAKVFAQIQQ